MEDVKFVFHLAASVGVKYILENQIDSIITNIRGTEILLDLAAREKIGILFASTSEVYGRNDDGSMKEIDNRIMGATTIHRWSYATAKALDEYLMMAFYREHLDRSGFEYAIFGHIGENHVHVNILPRSEQELETAKDLYLIFAKKAVELGGTVSGEHGVGKLKKAMLGVMYPDDQIGAMKAVKKAFDPNSLLNKGTLF